MEAVMIAVRQKLIEFSLSGGLADLG
jgi:hypothetical protein